MEMGPGVRRKRPGRGGGLLAGEGRIVLDVDFEGVEVFDGLLAVEFIAIDEVLGRSLVAIGGLGEFGFRELSFGDQ